MLGKKQIVFDIECDNLLPSVTKIHCLCWQEVGTENAGEFTDYEDIRKFVTRPDIVLVGHNICTYDIPVMEKILNIKILADKFDTLAVSWYKETKRPKHGLEGYGEEFGVQKPKVDDWENLTQEDYLHRCREDVKINTLLWEKQLRFLNVLYEYDDTQIFRFMKYIEFKLDCVAEQESVGIALDVKKTTEMAAILRKMELEKIQEIEKAMPKIDVKKVKYYENAVVDKNGNLAQLGDLFFSSMIESGGVTPVNKIEKVVGHKDPNAHSHTQIKKWLYSLDWVPEHIKFDRNKETGETKEIPQISSKEKDGTICPSIVKLYEKEPKLELLEGLSIITHRLKIFEGFLRDQRDGRLYPSAKGLTNTLRLKHAVVVNLPDASKKYGKDIRGCLVADEDHILIGTDLSGVEDNTKRHYIYKFDPDYVEEMNTDGFDPHLDIAVRAGMLSEEQAQNHKDKKEDHGNVRKKSKIVNFSATYKIGSSALARNSGMPIREAEKFLDIYWQRNGAILKVEEDTRTKEVAGQQWLYNPTSKFWYSLRNQKDIFSTLNQGTAVYVFDVWGGFLRKAGIKMSLQMHDEYLFNTRKELEQQTKAIIKECITKTNERLKLNVIIGCSADSGYRYSECH